MCAARTSALVGSQPALRQVPPTFHCSIIATRAPWPRASAAAVLPAAPAPTTIRSYGALDSPDIETPLRSPALYWRMTRDELERSDSGALGAAGPELPWCPRNLLRCNPRGGGDAPCPTCPRLPVGMRRRPVRRRFLRWIPSPRHSSTP